jgi:hypothetical protein
LEPFELTADGTYSVYVSPNQWHTGTATVTLHEVVDSSETITPGGGSVPFTIAVPGQVARFTFSAQAGEKATVTTALSSAACWSLVILKPDNTIQRSWSQCSTSVTRGPETLPATGTYTLVFDPNAGYTGNGSIALALAP